MYKRKLNEIEYFTWLIGQPCNISMAITIKGNLQKELIRKSLEKVQRRHPILQARLYVNDKGEPHFIWGEIGQIPIEIIPRTHNDLYKKIVAKEFITPFETGINSSYPLIRVKLLNSESVSDLIITIPHVIGNGMSMVFLFRDIIDYMVRPEKKVKPLEVIKNVEDILPSSFQKKIPKTPRKFKIILWFIKKKVILRKIKRKLGKSRKNQTSPVFNNNKKKQFLTRDWILTEDQSLALIKKCKENGVTVHSAICTLFLPDFPGINNPVNLRKKLKYNVGESVGMYAGGLIIKKNYKKRQSFWKNSQIYHKMLVKGLNSNKALKVFKLISRAVPLELFKELMSLDIDISQERSIWITNLGSIDKFNVYIASKDFIVENLYGGVSVTYDAVFVAVFTLENKIHFQLFCYKPPHTEEKVERYINNVIKQLDNALNINDCKKLIKKIY